MSIEIYIKFLNIKSFPLTLEGTENYDELIEKIANKLLKQYKINLSILSTYIIHAEKIIEPEDGNIISKYNIVNGSTLEFLLRKSESSNIPVDSLNIISDQKTPYNNIYI